MNLHSTLVYLNFFQKAKSRYIPEDFSAAERSNLATESNRCNLKRNGSNQLNLADSTRVELSRVNSTQFD